MIAKIDLKKAYDQMEWSFVDKAFEAWGFSKEIRFMIFYCVSTVSYEILVTGRVAGRVEPAKVLRQGDPLSPYLFILNAEVLSRLIANETGIHGISVSRGALPITHLLYADDLLLASREINANAMVKCLNYFCVWFSQQVNTDQSSIMFSKNTKPVAQRTIKMIFGFKEMRGEGEYLGNFLIFGKNKERSFGKLKERLSRRLEGWRSQLLSKAEKATLIRSMAQAIPVYTMSTFKVLKGVCGELDRLVRRFWWGAKANSRKGFASKSWRSICKPKREGGLGFRMFEHINLGLFRKLGWKIANGDESLWVMVMRKKYMKIGNLFNCKKKTGAAYYALVR